jgi:hypothetical protein
MPVTEIAFAYIKVCHVIVFTGKIIFSGGQCAEKSHRPYIEKKSDEMLFNGMNSA